MTTDDTSPNALAGNGCQPLTRRAMLRIAAPAAAGALIAGAGCSRPATREAVGATADRWDDRVADLDRRIRQSMAALNVPGVAVALVRDAALAWTRTFGVRDRSSGLPVDEHTVFSGQSMSKPVFAYRVLKLCELGVLDLDAPLTRYTREVFVDDPHLDQITARRVLSHTTGLPNWRTNEEPLRITFAPGTQWSYSGEGYYYLQTVVSALTGRTDPATCSSATGPRVCATDFGDYMEATVLRPFGMHDSGYVWTPAMEAKIATRHGAKGEPLPAMRSTALDVARYGSAGSLMTTAADFARFLTEMMRPAAADDYRLSEASRREMLRPHVQASASPMKTSWALGWQIWHREPGDVAAHGGDFDGWHCQSAFSPARQTGFVILTNGEGGLSMIWNDLLDVLLKNFVFA